MEREEQGPGNRPGHLENRTLEAAGFLLPLLTITCLLPNVLFLLRKNKSPALLTV
jgi:hypothetical protein